MPTLLAAAHGLERSPRNDTRCEIKRPHEASASSVLSQSSVSRA